MTQKETIKKVLHYIRRYRFFLIVSLVLALITVVLTLYVPILTGQAVDLIVGKGQVDFAGVYHICVKIGIAILLTMAAQWVMNVANNKITYSVVRDIRTDAFEKIQILPLSYIDSHSYGGIVSRVIADADQFADGLLMGFTQLFTGVLTILGTIFFMVRVSLPIALVVIVLTPVSLLVAKFVASRTYAMFQLQAKHRGEQTAYADEMIENQVKMYTQRTGKYDKVDAYEDNDMLKGLLAQLDEEGNTKEGGIQVEAAVLMPAYMKNDDQKAIFANAKVNDVLVFNPNVAYDGHAAELGSLLKIDKEIAKDVKSDFSFQVEEITRFVPGDSTQEVFDQAFGEGVVKTEEEFRAKIKEEIAARFVADSDYKFLIDIRKVMMEKVGKLEFSDALLKRIMLLNNEEKGEEYVAENYDKSIEELTWHLIKEQLVEANDIKVEQEDVLKMARETTKAQFAQYGMLSIPDDVLDNYAQEMLKKKETINNLVSRVVEVKLAAALKAQVTLENKNVSIEEFNKMFE